MKYLTISQHLPSHLDAGLLYQELCSDQQYSFLFESAEYHAHKGRYTFIGFSPARIFRAEAASTENLFTALKNELDEVKESFEQMPLAFPHAPALFGYISFEAARFIEKVQMHENMSTIPDAILFVPDCLIVIDHTQSVITLHATEKKFLDQCMSTISNMPEKKGGDDDKEIIFKRAQLTDHLIKEIPLEKSDSFNSAFSKAKEHIAAGDLMQLVISQQLSVSSKKSPFELYVALKKLSPAPYQYLLTFPDFSIVGSSPETLVRVEESTVITRPIAGTRRRGKNKLEDEQLAFELTHDTKEHAEHAMLVDLGRNDLGKVCVPGSVTVTRICDLEKFSTVMHLVSEVQGTLEKTCDSIDAFMACFPAGTLSGAPKKRALERIIELEKAPRGIYGGAVGYIACNGAMDFAIAIRTMLHTGSSVQLQAGAGIVADSQAQSEDAECRTKMKAPYFATIA